MIYRGTHYVTVVKVGSETFAPDCMCGWRGERFDTHEDAAKVRCGVLVAELEGSKRRAEQRVLQTV